MGTANSRSTAGILYTNKSHSNKFSDHTSSKILYIYIPDKDVSSKELIYSAHIHL